MELWLIRHPKPVVAPDICYGRMDLAVVADDLELAVQRLAGCLPPRLYSSPARRCRALAERLDAAPGLDPRLQERSFGQWEGKTWDEIGRAPLDAWAADPWDYAPPGGESTRMLLARVEAALDEAIDVGHAVAWVTHQGVIRAVAGRLLGLPAECWMKLQLDYGSAWRLVRRDGAWDLIE